ncbi:MAG: DUF948 domain-containing protein [Acidobacteriota bacterium]|nr:DUF948 domain-containing protein [Acidobacteriota bacterium]MDW3229557.1 DUF948 domain-containing protein [Acidobacteriota bacterium]MDY0231074.1 DUF948 domain-containing protein [Candidatus Saccharicenans sp.]
MLLTFNQVLYLILTVAAAVLVTYIVLFLIQLKRTFIEAEKAIQDLQVNLKKLEKIEDKLDRHLDEAGSIINSTKKTISGLSELSMFMTSRVIRPASRYWPILFPMLRFSWQLMKKRKEKKNVR